MAGQEPGFEVEPCLRPLFRLDNSPPPRNTFLYRLRRRWEAWRAERWQRRNPMTIDSWWWPLLDHDGRELGVQTVFGEDRGTSASWEPLEMERLMRD